MASPLDRKASFIEWVRTGKESYSPTHNEESKKFYFLDAVINFADTSSVMKAGDWNLEARIDKKAPVRKQIMKGLKYVDLLIQLLTGTLLFGLLQAAAERLRAVSGNGIDDAKKNSKLLLRIGWNIASAASIVLALVARVGLFVTQIFAAAIRFPLALVSGVVGLIWGVVTPTPTHTLNNTKQRHIIACISDFIWPFAPMAQRTLVIANVNQTVIPGKNTVSEETASKVASSRTTMAIYALSFLIALTLIILLSVGTFGAGGLAAMPFMNTLVSGIAFVFNNLFGFAGLHIAGSTLGAAGGLASFPVLSGLSSFFGLSSGIGAKIMISTMLTGALTSFFGQVFRAASEVPASLAKEIPGSVSSSPRGSPGGSSHTLHEKSVGALTPAHHPSTPFCYVIMDPNQSETDNQSAAQQDSGIPGNTGNTPSPRW